MRNIILIIIEVVLLVALVFLKYSNHFYSKYIDEHYELNVLANFAFFFLVVGLVRSIILNSYAKGKGLARQEKDNFQFGVDNIARVVVGAGVIAALFGLFGVYVTTLLTSLSIVAAAIAIITKEYISDFIVGIYFSFSKDFEINDYVKIGEHKGKITGIKMLKLKVLNDDDDMVIIPNTKVYANEIINYTKSDIRLLSIDFQLDISTIDNIETLEDELIEALATFKDYIEPNSYNLKIVEMKKDCLDLKFQYTLLKLDRNVQRDIRKKTVRQVFNHVSGKKTSQIKKLANHE
jgi:small-conductance mechanosensitive channel